MPTHTAPTKTSNSLRGSILVRLADTAEDELVYGLTGYAEDPEASQTILVIDANTAQLIKIYDNPTLRINDYGMTYTVVLEGRKVTDVSEILDLSDRGEIRDYLVEKMYPNGCSDYQSVRCFERLFSSLVRRPLM